MALNKNQKKEIKEIVKQKLTDKVMDFKERGDMNKPFYTALFTKKQVYMYSLLQSTFTWFGSKWEKFAEIVAKKNFEEVKRREAVGGKITSSARSEIDSILDELDDQVSKPNIKQEKKRVLKASKKDRGQKALQQVDLILKNGRKDFYLEIKSVMPNKNEVKAAKRDLLKIVAMKGDVDVYMVMPYNPYFSDAYPRWTVNRFFKRGDDLLVGKEFWDFLGGQRTYSDLLKLFSDVGKETEDLLEKAPLAD